MEKKGISLLEGGKGGERFYPPALTGKIRHFSQGEERKGAFSSLKRKVLKKKGGRNSFRRGEWKAISPL